MPAKTLTDEHKEAIARGRVEARAVSDYLEALATGRRKRGRQRTPESIRARLAAIEEQLADADPLTRLNLWQEQRDLSAELEAKEQQQEAGAGHYEAAFVEHAKSYGDRKGISYRVWRESGVPPAVLTKAGIRRSL